MRPHVAVGERICRRVAAAAASGRQLNKYRRLHASSSVYVTSSSNSSTTIDSQPFRVNGRTYNPPSRPIAVICMDGSENDYLDVSIQRGRMPRLQRFLLEGQCFRTMARGALPSFTNINNACIATGTPPSVHGISGNFFLDPDTGEEVMMNSASFLRCGTIFSKAAQAGRKVAVVTAKEKLRDILAHELALRSGGTASGGGGSGIAFSAEKAKDAMVETHGITGMEVEALVGSPTPEIYSPEASLFVLRAGVALLQEGISDFMYLSLTDYMQHKYAPEDEESLAFYQAIDVELGKLVDLGAIVGATADHGMNAKQDITAGGKDGDGRGGPPNVIYLESLLTSEEAPFDELKAAGIGDGLKVILPITDPYVLHHASLGSCAYIHLPTTWNSQSRTQHLIDWLLQVDGITEVYTRETAARVLELPSDRIGDLVVLSGRHVVLGKSPDYHDLQAVGTGLRSHGGRYEEMVPFLILDGAETGADGADGSPVDDDDELRNFDIFERTCNGTLIINRIHSHSDGTSSA